MAVALAAGLGVLAAGQHVLTALVPASALLAFGLVVRPQLATLVVVALVYTNASVIAVQFHGLPIAIHAAVPLLLLLPFAFHALLQRQPIVASAAMPLLLAYLLVQLISALVSRDSLTAGENVARYIVEGVVPFFLLTNVIRTTRSLRQVLWLLLFVGAALAALSVYQQVSGTTDQEYLGFAQTSRESAFVIGEDEADVEVQPRSEGPIGEVNRYAQILVVLLPLGVFQLRSERGRLARTCAAIATGLIFLGVVYTFSRGAALGVVLTVLAMLLLRTIKLRHLALPAVAFIVLVWTVPTYADRLTSLSGLSSATSATPGQTVATYDTSIKSRTNEVLAATLAFTEHPIIGVGPGLYPSYYLEYAQEVPGLPGQEDIESHNLYLGVAAETGVLGLFCFLGILLIILRDLLRVRRNEAQKRPAMAALATGLALAVVAYMSTGLFLHLAYQRYLWLLLALGAAVVTVARAQDDNVDEELSTVPVRGRADAPLTVP